jgi:acetylcholinesterase
MEPFLTSSNVDSVLQLYPDNPSLGVPYGRFDGMVWPEAGLQWRRSASIIGDFVMIAPSRLSAQIYSSTGSSPPATYKYRFNVTNPAFSGYPEYFGSTHGYEVNFVWNSPDVKTTSNYSHVAGIMARSWASFVSDLDPNHHGIAGVPNWDQYSSRPEGANFVIQIGGYGMESDIYRFEGIDFINRVTISTSH